MVVYLVVVALILLCFRMLFTVSLICSLFDDLLLILVGVWVFAVD